MKVKELIDNPELLPVGPDGPYPAFPTEQIVLAIGTRVIIGGDIEALINSVSFYGLAHELSYEVIWWDERTRKKEWVGPNEIDRIASDQSVRERRIKFQR